MRNSFPRSVSLLAVAIMALCGRIYFEFAYVDFNMDKARQLYIAQCFEEGKGIAYNTADLSDLSRTDCRRVDLWAVGHPLMVAALDAGKGDLVLSSILLDALGLVLLFLAFHVLFRLLLLSGTAFVLFMTFSAFTFAPYYDAGSTDHLAAALYLLASALALKSLWASRSTPLLFVLIGVLCFGAAFFRYAYYPFLGIVPLILILAGFKRKDRRAMYGGLIVGVTSFVLLAGMLVFQHSYFGSAMIEKAGMTMYPANLLRIDSFPLKAFFYTDILAKNIEAGFPALSGLVRPASLLLSLLVLAVIIHHFLGCRARKSTQPEPHRAFYFLLLLFFTLVLNVALFSYYSCRISPEIEWTDSWTYVQETRYFLPTIYLIQVALVLALFKNNGKGLLIRYGLAVFLSAALIFSVSFGVYRAYRLHGGDGTTKYLTLESEIDPVLNRIRALQGSSPGSVVYADGLSIHNACLVALKSSARIVLDYQSLIATPLRSSAPVTLFVRMPRKRSTPEKAFLQSHQAEQDVKLRNAEFFRIELSN